MADRIPPHNEAAERSVLGAALQSKQALYDTMETLNSEDFYIGSHALIFDAMYRLHKSNSAVDTVTVSEELGKSRKLSAVGGRSYLTELASLVPSPSNAMQYAAIIREKSKLRMLIERSGDIITMSYESREAADNILSKAENEILEISQKTQTHEMMPLKEAVKQTIENIIEHKNSDRKLLGITTGFGELNKMTSGFQKQDLIIVAARPSAGKTALALNFAMNAALKEDASVLIFSLEMGEQALAQRLLSSISEVPLAKIRDGGYLDSTANVKKINRAVERMQSLKIEIDGSSGISVNEMKNKCRRMKQRHGSLDLVLVDYLQLMSLSGSERPDNRTLEIAAITRMLKLMAKEIDCPVILLSQTSRDYEKRSGRPMLSDLRDSGAIEQDADLIMFIHNKTAKELKESSDDDDDQYDPEVHRMILLLKHRNGETGDVILEWKGEYTKFVDPVPTSWRDRIPQEVPDEEIEEMHDIEDMQSEENYANREPLPF